MLAQTLLLFVALVTPNQHNRFLMVNIRNIKLASKIRFINKTMLTFHIRPKYSSTSGFMEWTFERRGSLKPHRTSWTVRVINMSTPKLVMYIETKVRRKKE